MTDDGLFDVPAEAYVVPLTDVWSVV